jgi:general secretion pathway protein D
MKNLKYIYQIIFLFLLIHNSLLIGQQNINQILSGSEGKYISYPANTSFCDFLDYIEFLYQKYDNKNIVVNTNCRFPIGLELNNIFYKNALQEICNQNNLNLLITKSQIAILNNQENKLDKVEENLFNEKRQVKISAVLFEANLDKMKERGVNWDFILSKNGMEINGGFISSQSKDRNLGIRTASDLGKFSGYTSAMFRFLESENLGNIVSKMSVVVNDEEKSKMQVGSDISVKQLDFAGNVTDAFFPTGTIINVEPRVLIQDTLKIVKLKIHIERSLPHPDELSTEISRTYTDTEVMLKDQEEMIVGSLLVDEDLIIREGIPVLKDLPWWVLGLRYLTGYDSKSVVHKEVVILVNAEILPLIKDRIIGNENMIQERIKTDNELINKLKNNN